jgi:hypothetical protein
MPIDLISKIKPKNDGDFPVCEDVDIEGGYQVRADITDRNSIPTLNRKIGMLVYVQSEEKYYTLSGGTGNEHWVEAQMGGGGGFTAGGDLSGSSTNQTVIGLNTVPLPEALPESQDIIKANLPLLLSTKPFGITTDGTNIWVADIYNPYDNDTNPYHSSNYGGIVKIEYPNTYISTRYDYDATMEIGSVHRRIYTVAYLDGYLYATGTANLDGWMSRIWKINPANGAIIDEYSTPSLALVYSAGSTLWYVIPGEVSSLGESSPLWKVDPNDLSTQTMVELSEYISGKAPYYTGFTYDSTNNKIWFSTSVLGYIFKIDPNTLSIDLAISDYVIPNGMAYDGTYVWVSCSYVTHDAIDINVLDPSDGTLVHTVSDTTNLIHNNLLIAYDSDNDKIWCPSYSTLGKFDPPGTIGGNRIISINASTFIIDGIGQLSSSVNNSIICAGGYVWVVDNPEIWVVDNPEIELMPISVVKIDPSQITPIPDPDNPPFYEGQNWGGILAEIDSGRLAYTFIPKNSANINDSTTDMSGMIYVNNSDEVVLVMPSSSVYLPSTPVDGQKHTIIDALGSAGEPYGSIYIYSQDTYYGDTYYNLQFTIDENRGAVTFVWSATQNRWYIISYFGYATKP